MSVRLIIVNTTLNILKDFIASSGLNTARLQPPRMDFIQWNVTKVGINAVATSTGAFLRPNPYVLIRNRMDSTTMSYLQNPRQTGTHRWYATEENLGKY